MIADHEITHTSYANLSRQVFSILASTEIYETLLNGWINEWILNKMIEEQKCWIKLIQDLRGLVKAFSILASTESLVLTLNCFYLFWWFIDLYIMHFSDIIGKLGSNHISRYFWFLHWQKLYLQGLAALLIFFLLVCKLCKSGL